MNWEDKILKTCEDVRICMSKVKERKKSINSRITGLSNWVEESLKMGVGVCLYFAGKQRNPFKR